MIKGVRHRDGVSGVDVEPVPLWLDVDQARAAAAMGLKLDPAKPKESAVLETPSRPRSALQMAQP